MYPITYGISASTVSSPSSKQANRFRVQFYDEDQKQIAKELSNMIFGLQLPRLFNPARHDENADWVMYSVDGCAIDDEDLGIKTFQVLSENDIGNKAMRDLYELGCEEPFTMSVQYLDDSDQVIEVLTFQDTTLDSLQPSLLNLAENGPAAMAITFIFEIIIHSFRK